MTRIVLSPVDACLIVMPPCVGEGDRFSLEALRHIHKQLDDDNDGGIEVNESVEVSSVRVRLWFCSVDAVDNMSNRMF